MTLLPHLPDPGQPLDWAALDDAFDWIRAMRLCPQDPIHHAEGDVWIHVRMVCEALMDQPAWAALGEPHRSLLLTAALLHDVAKPATTRVENGRITARGHSAAGALRTRRTLWEHGADPILREHAAALVRHHQVPYFLIDRPQPERTAFLISQSARCDLLALLATADTLGRVCADQQRLLTNIALFRALCEEHACLEAPRAFPSPLSRFEYFRSETRDPHYHAHDVARCEVLLTAGLPGAGKDTWIATHAPGLPVISLDAIRAELRAAPTGGQGAVVQTAKQRARTFLREGQPFVWNATNLTRDLRAPLIDLFTAYHARVRLIHVEAPRHRLLEQNTNRAQPVPPAALDRMLDRWETPDPTEAPIVEWWENQGTWRRIVS